MSALLSCDATTDEWLNGATTPLYDGHELTISTIVLFELEYGIRKSSHVKANEERMGAFLKMEIGSLDVSYEDVAAAAVIRANLERLKQPIGPLRHLDCRSGYRPQSDAGDSECSRILASTGLEMDRLVGVVRPPSPAIR